MASPDPEIFQPDSITKEQFHHILQVDYPRLMKATSRTKNTLPWFKKSSKTFEEFQHWRYVTAPEAYRGKDTMQFIDVRRLVDWKLWYGKYRPMIKKYIQENRPSVVEAAVRESVALFRQTGDAPGALETMFKDVKGMGPATASLVLAVMHPDRVVFFGDDAFLWLCRGADPKARIRYSVKEYRELDMAARRLVVRLGVDLVDIERVSYVLMQMSNAARAGTKLQKGTRERKTTTTTTTTTTTLASKQDLAEKEEAKNNIEAKVEEAPPVPEAPEAAATVAAATADTAKNLDFSKLLVDSEDNGAEEAAGKGSSSSGKSGSSVKRKHSSSNSESSLRRSSRLKRGVS